MDDFVLNFDTSAAPSTSKARGEKGGRWTDRAKAKRSHQTQTKRAIRPNNSSATPSTSHDAPDPSANRPRFDPTARPPATNGDRQGGPRTYGGPNPRQGGAPFQAKKAFGPDGKEQFVSSLFTAEGLPEPQRKAPAGPVAPARPSNAPQRAVEEDMDDQDEAEADEEKEEGPRRELATSPLLAKLGLNAELVSHLVTKMGVTGPTACQATCVPPLLAGNKPAQANTSITRARDAILQAQTGSGKTLAFLLPLVSDLLSLPASVLGSHAATREIGTLALILAPTRELAAQIHSVLETLLSLPSSSNFTFPARALTPGLLVGGANRTHEKRRLRKGCPIVVATPGRLLDHLRTTESFRLAGEPIKAKGPRGRPGNANTQALGSRGGRQLGLRWLVVDECDRLMDLGFEEQMKGVLEELEKKSPSDGMGERSRRTILCSATASEGVDRLAGMALQDPVVLKVTGAPGETLIPTPAAKPAKDENGNDVEMQVAAPVEEATFVPPAQLVHNYISTPPKLRFVALVALLRKLFPRSRPASQGTKVVIFLSCTAAVDFYWRALEALAMGNSIGAGTARASNQPEGAKARVEREAAEVEAKKNKMASYSKLLPGVPIYRLHGNLELAQRQKGLGGFAHASEVRDKDGEPTGEMTENAVLLCTSVAARGLDVSGISHVIQYDLPTEGGVTEYVHRAGRTARAGAAGQVTTLLLPTEAEWVPWVEAGMKERTANKTQGVRLREVGIEAVLRDGYGGEGREFETRATDVQMGLERWVAEEEEVRYKFFVTLFVPCVVADFGLPGHLAELDRRARRVPVPHPRLRDPPRGREAHV